VDVKPYDGPIGSAPSETTGWIDTYHESWDEPWKPGENRKSNVTVRSRNLPRAGTYIVRFSVQRYDPQESPYKEFLNEMSKVPDLTKEQKDALWKSSEERMKEWGQNPYGPQPGVFVGRQVFTGTIIDYFRVEDVSAVLNFWLVVGTLGVVLATLLLAVLGLATA
jgi:hypothetical protein